MIRIRAALFASLLLLAGACAENTVRVQAASTVAQLSTSVVRAVRTYFTTLGERRREALVTLLASDPNCRWGREAHIIVGRTTSADLSRLCADREAPDGSTFALNLRGYPEEALKLATSELALITAYHSALAAAVENEPTRFAEDLFFAVDLAGAIQTDVAKIVGTQLNLLSAEQVTAARGLITLIDTLRTEARQVAEIRAVVAREGAAVPAALTQIEAQLTRAESLIGTNSELMEQIGRDRGYAAEASRMTFEERRRMLSSIAAAAEASDDAQGRIAPLKRAIAELRKADEELRGALEGRYTEEMKRQIVRLNRQRLLQVISSIAGLIPA